MLRYCMFSRTLMDNESRGVLTKTRSLREMSPLSANMFRSPSFVVFLMPPSQVCLSPPEGDVAARQRFPMAQRIVSVDDQHFQRFNVGIVY